MMHDPELSIQTKNYHVVIFIALIQIADQLSSGFVI